jgi:hypothetical protein
LTDYDPDHVKAIKGGNTLALHRWLDAGGDPKKVYQQMQLLDHAVVHGNAEAARKLLARGAKPWDGLLPYARSSGSQELIDLLRGESP